MGSRFQSINSSFNALYMPLDREVASLASRKPSTSTRATLLINDDALAIFVREIDEADNFFLAKN